MSELDVVDAHHSYGAQPVLNGVSVHVERGTFLAVLGASGSGKTTLLRLVAGFERLRSGALTIGGQLVDDGRRVVPPEKRRVGYVPQEGALFPHLRVEANVGFGVKRGRREPKVRDLLEMVGLAGYEKRFPHELSGGQQQRVALARALAVEPEVVLLDEPFSALDAAMRVSIRRDVAQILHERGTTTILVTHDQDEALSMSDRVAVLRSGLIVAEGRPEALYRSPVDAPMAEFLGEANLIPGKTAGRSVSTSLGTLDLQEGVVESWGTGAGAATVLVRPEQLEITDRSWASVGRGIPATVVERSYFGHDAVLHVLPDRSLSPEFDVSTLLARLTGVAAPLPGSRVLLSVRGPVMAWPDGATMPADDTGASR